jgi:hypothetical protein
VAAASAAAVAAGVGAAAVAAAVAAVVPAAGSSRKWTLARWEQSVQRYCDCLKN